MIQQTQVIKMNNTKNNTHMHESGIEHFSGEMPQEETLQNLANLFKVFGDSTRVKILFVLAKSDMCVYHIAETLDMTISAISHQLSVLNKANLVTSQRQGKTIYYSLADEHVRLIFEQGLDHVCE